MKAKLAAIVIAKLRIWTALCTPFVGETPPTSVAAARACSRAQITLTDAIHAYEAAQ